MAIIRTAKGLQEVQDQTLRDRLNQLNAGQTTSAAQAAAIGATPKQQDMAGSQARKESVIKENLAPKQDQLSVADRYIKQQGDLSAAQQGTLTEAQKLAKLAGLDTRIQKLTEQRVNQVAAQPVVRNPNESELAKVIPATDPRYQQAATALKDYANDPAKQEAALVQLQNLGITPAQVNNLLEATDTALGRAANVDQLKASDLDADVRSMGYAGGMLELSQQLGKDVSGLSIEDLTAEIQAYRDRVTSEKERLEAEAMSSTGLQQQAAMQRLKTFGQAGGIGQEQAVERALQPIDMAATVQVGSSTMPVDQLLRDEDFSNLIEEWAISSPEQREKLIPSGQFGPLVQWLTQHEQTLKDVASAGQQAQQQVATTQTGVQDLGKDVFANRDTIKALVPGFDPSKAYTAEQLATMDSQLKASPVYQYAQSSPEGRTYINSLKPDELSQVKSMTMPQLQQQAATYNKVISSPGIQSRYNIDPNSKVFDESQITAVDNFSKLPDYIQSVGTDPDFKDLSIDQLRYFDRDGKLNNEMVDEYRQFIAEQKAAISENDESVVADVFGAGTAEAINAKRAELKARADYGDPAAVQALRDLDAMDANKDGTIDAKDARIIAGERKAELAGKGADYFKTQYGTGAKGYETASEKYGKLGQSIATNTGVDVYGQQAVVDAIKSGDFSKFSYLNPDDYKSLTSLLASYDKSGVSSGSRAKIADALDKMNKQFNTDADLAYDTLIKQARKPGDYDDIEKLLTNEFGKSKHPLAAETLARLLNKLKKDKKLATDLANMKPDIKIDTSNIKPLPNNWDIGQIAPINVR